MALIIASILFLLSIVNLAISIAVLNSTRNRQGRLISLSLLSSAVGIFAYGMEILSSDLEIKLNWIIVRYASLSIFVLFISLSILLYLRIPVRISVITMVLISIIPLAAVVLVNLHHVTGLMYSNIWLEKSGDITILRKTTGPFYLVNQIFIMLLPTGLSIMVGYFVRNSSKLILKQASIIIVGMGIPILTNLLYLLGYRPLGFINISVFAYFPSALILWYGIHHYNLAQIRPIAREKLLDQLQDGIVIIDELGTVIDINMAAEKIFQTRESRIIGQAVKNLNPDLGMVFVENDLLEDEIKVININDRTIEASFSPITLSGSEYAGCLIILRDVHDRLEAEKLREAGIQQRSAWMERRKIARTLHDSIVQYLNSLSFLAATAQQRLEQSKFDQLPQIISHIETSSRQAAADLRSLILELQIESESDRSFELIAAISERIKIIEDQSNIKINLKKPVSVPLNSVQQREVFYILLEAINNCIQHSEASDINVRMQNSGEIFSVEISDNGIGFDMRRARQGGMGLTNIKERSRQLSGLLSVKSSPGEGTTINLDIPVRTIPKFPVL